MHDITILRLEEVIKKTGLGRSTIFKLSADPSNDFPNRIRLSANAIGWYAHEIDAYLANRQRVNTPQAND
jgi:prophage regulatory protein